MNGFKLRSGKETVTGIANNYASWKQYMCICVCIRIGYYKELIIIGFNTDDYDL